MPFGLRPAFHKSGFVRPTAYPDGVLSTYGTGILKYQPVTIVTSGKIEAVAAGTNDWLGVFAGCEYITTDGRHIISNQWPASQTYVAGTMVAYVWDDSKIVYEVQADDAMAIATIGDEADFSGVTAGSTVTGLSAAMLDATVKTVGVQGQMRIIGLAPAVDNAWGDAYTVVQVLNARPLYDAIKVAI
jgi:hypothetical protein